MGQGEWVRSPWGSCPQSGLRLRCWGPWGHWCWAQRLWSIWLVGVGGMGLVGVVRWLLHASINHSADYHGGDGSGRVSWAFCGREKRAEWLRQKRKHRERLERGSSVGPIPNNPIWPAWLTISCPLPTSFGISYSTLGTPVAKWWDIYLPWQSWHEG